jgi:hypothetical protein
MAKATFTVGVFGLACWNDDGTLRIKVNVRTDQARQRGLAGLPADSPVKIIDMPGGGVEIEDFPDPKQASLLEVLRREIMEETGGCSFDPLDAQFSGPVIAITNTIDPAKPTGDLAFWMPIRLYGMPVPSNEASEHPWISRQQLEEETEYRAVGGLGKAGRTGRMLRDAFIFYEMNKHHNLFSTPGG